MTESVDRFKNRKEALLWLQQRGQISTGKFYQDCADGKITIHTDKTISKYEVMQYAEKVFGFVRQTAGIYDLNEKKEKLDIQERELKVAKLQREKEQSERELDKLWKHRDESDEELAGIIGLVLEAYDHYCYEGAPALIQICNGDVNRVDEVYASVKAMFSAAINDVLADGHIEGVFEEVDIAEADF